MSESQIRHDIVRAIEKIDNMLQSLSRVERDRAINFCVKEMRHNLWFSKLGEVAATGREIPIFDGKTGPLFDRDSAKS